MNPIIATNASPSRSEKYKFASTIDIKNFIESHGFSCTEARYNRVNKRSGIPNTNKIGYQKHMLKFDHPELLLDNGNKAQIILKNSHDGSTGVKVYLGIYRLACENGLMIGSEYFSGSIKHIGNNFYNDLRMILEQALIKAKDLGDILARMKNKVLNELEIEQIITNALKLRLGEDFDLSTIDQSSFRIKREADIGQDLYTVFNRVQELVIRGGIKYKSEIKDTNGNVLAVRFNTTRAIKSIDSDIELNQELFSQALKLAA